MAQGKAQGQVVQHTAEITAVALNQQGIAPDRQVCTCVLRQDREGKCPVQALVPLLL